jgi:hypothetical protein
MTEAHKFTEMFEGVRKVKYNQEMLYNILMEDYNIINVNNLMCETLHPNNLIAKLYSYTGKKRTMLTKLLNHCILTNNPEQYAKVVRTIKSPVKC